MLSTVLTTAQEVLNGSFEDNTFSPLYEGNGCPINYDCNEYHQKMAHSNAWETQAETLDIPFCSIGGIFEGCTELYDFPSWGPTPQHGEWSILIYGSHLESSWGASIHNRANAISLALSQPLQVGTTYALSYYVRSTPPTTTPLTYNSMSLSVGISEKDTSFGEYIHTSVMPDSVWRWQSVIFEATIPAQHLTFKINTPSPQTDVLLHYSVLLDNVSISTNLELAEQAMEGLSVYPNPFVNRLHIETLGSRIGLYDLLGQRHYDQKIGESKRATLVLDDLPLGIYLIKTYDAQGRQLGVEKVLKMRD